MWKPRDFNGFTDAVVILEAVSTANCQEIGLVPKQMNDFGIWISRIWTCDFCIAEPIAWTSLPSWHFFYWSQEIRAGQDPVWASKEVKKSTKSNMSSWCSWLSRLSNTQTVSSSNLDEDSSLFFFLKNALQRSIHPSVSCVHHCNMRIGKT